MRLVLVLAATWIWPRAAMRSHPETGNPITECDCVQSYATPDPPINSARDLAWNNARLLWAVRDDPLARGLFLDSLAASTALASRMLLVAV